MEQKDLTIWQRLSKTFGPNSLLNMDGPSYKIDKKVLLRTPDKQEYEREKLQIQQSLYIQDNWKKIENNLYAQAVYYEPNRLSAFYDYESMEYTPEISVALDIFAEEATTANENGKVLTIYSDSSRIKNELTNLFENILDINANLTSWARNVCKYGDNLQRSWSIGTKWL